ncbi:hypothetical protein H5T54_06435 [Candidatus Bipolaricaulota bacterium]|nr:hypothetical protein [Candidatus Bipolaricaulota bacterium]
MRFGCSCPRSPSPRGFSLGRTLAELGMRDAFSSLRADFSGMTGRRDLRIDDVFHKAFVAVDETGTKTAAATR